MDQGRELDALIAEKVMGKSPDYYHCPHFDARGRMLSFCGCPDMPHYSKHIKVAWEVVEHLAKQGFTMHLEWKGSDREYPLTAEVMFSKIWTAGHAVADNAAHAICLAALEVIEADEEE